MSASAPSAATSALAELLEVSPQVDAAVILERDGGHLLASAPSGSDRMADRLGATCVRILDAAEQARNELGREPVAQVEVATPDGHVFVVADARWIVAAVTDADPTVGLVFYDLKTALRTVRESVLAEPSSNGSGPDSMEGAPLVVEATATGDDAPADDAQLDSFFDDVGDAGESSTASGDDDGNDAAGESSDDADAGSGEGSSEASTEGQSASRWRRRKS